MLFPIAWIDGKWLLLVQDSLFEAEQQFVDKKKMLLVTGELWSRF